MSMSPHSLSLIRRALQHLADTADGVAPSREPSHRAQEIYRRVAVNCEPQKDVARDLGVSSSRISQVVRRVRTWLAQGSQSPADLLNRTDRRRLNLALNKARHEGIYHRALRDYDHHHAHPTSTTTRTESKPVGWAVPTNTADDVLSTGNGQPATAPQSTIRNPQSEITKVVSTTRPLPPNVRLLNTAQRSAIELDRLASSDDIPDPEPKNQMPSDDALYWALIGILFDLRRRAEADGRVPTSTNIDELLHNALRALLGIRDAGTGFLHLDDALRHYLKSFLLGPRSFHSSDPEPDQALNDLLNQHDTPEQPSSANPQSAICNPHLPPPPLNSPQLNPLPSPSNSAPTPSPATSSTPDPQKPKPTSTTPQPEPPIPLLSSICADLVPDNPKINLPMPFTLAPDSY